MMHSYFNRQCRKLSSLPVRRSFSSRNDRNRTYLENWVGSKPKTNHFDTNASSNKGQFDVASPSGTIQHSLQVTGLSYLLPTLRLPRNTLASSLSSDLSSFLNGGAGGHAGTHVMKSMLKPKTAPGNISWRVPIILDLSAFQHDGSPHYKPPEAGFVNSIVSVLDEWGISVMGVTNVQTVENVSDEISKMGLPVLGRVGSGRTLGKGSNSMSGGGTSGNAVGVEELVQLVLKHSEENAVEGEAKEQQEEIEEADDNFSNEEISNLQDEGSQDEDAKMQRAEIMDLSFRDLQKECKSLEIGAIGNTAALRTKLLEFYGYSIDDLDDDNEHDDAEANEEEEDTYQSSAEEAFDISSALEAPHIVPPKIYHGTVRSGQQVHSVEANQSLIIIGNVSSGGEAVADGNIYIFGSLRGRALAGLSDPDPDADVDGSGASDSAGLDRGSKIICTHFDAELICIKDTYTTVGSVEELGLEKGNGAIISTNEDGLSVVPF